MKYSKFFLTNLVLSPIFFSQILMADDSDDNIDVDVGGFIRVDVGGGDRYGDVAGEDRVGISKAAISVTAEQGNVKGVFVLGTEITSEQDSNADGNIDIKDAFIVWGNDTFNLSAGAQPVLFGLKAEGYPGDHSIHPSIEFGAGGAFAVANQAGASAFLNWSYHEQGSFRFGVFDSKNYEPAGPAAATDGSTVGDNVMFQWRGNDLGGSGIYAVLGAESVYIGGAVEDNASLSTAGLGWTKAGFDFSFEVFALDAELAGTAEDETYSVFEMTFPLGNAWRLYLDYSEADEMVYETSRVGLNYTYSDMLMVTLEASEDDWDVDSVSSIDFRLTASF